MLLPHLVSGSVLSLAAALVAMLGGLPWCEVLLSYVLGGNAGLLASATALWRADPNPPAGGSRA